MEKKIKAIIPLQLQEVLTTPNKRRTLSLGVPLLINYPMLSSVSLAAAFSWVIGAIGVSSAIQIGVPLSNREIRRRSNGDAKFRPWRLSFRSHVRRRQFPYYAVVNDEPSQLSHRRKSHYRKRQEDKQRMAYILGIPKIIIF
jgi:hypothetical protein